MQAAPTISIALCTYNGQEFLREQLDSVLRQTFTDWELVAFDDASDDATWQILREYAARDTRFRVDRNVANLGYNKNFEKALKSCTGTYIAICDQDDIWREDKLEQQLAAIPGHELIYHDSEFIDSGGKPMKRKISDKFRFFRGNRPEAFLLMNCVSGHSILMTNTLLQKSLPFPTDFHYDQWLAFHAANTGSIDFIDASLVQYRQHRSNNTDMLALHAVAKDPKQKIIELERESHWLLLCAEKTDGARRDFIQKLYEKSIQRNGGYLNFAFGMTVWKYRDILLPILKKSDISKFFFALRKIWGSKAKMIA